jgi:hypothetical protein
MSQPVTSKMARHDKTVGCAPTLADAGAPMTTPFYTRLKTYFEMVGGVLRGEANAASIFPNSTDKCISSEHIYSFFLQSHLPSSCNVLFGGFAFSIDGAESKQIDLLVTTGTCPQFNFHNKRKRSQSGIVVCE